MQRQRPRLKPFFNHLQPAELQQASQSDCTPRGPAPAVESTTPTAAPSMARSTGRSCAASRLAEDAQPYQCAGPDCTVMIEPAFTPGRRKVYHDDACRERAKTARRQPCSPPSTSSRPGRRVARSGNAAGRRGAAGGRREHRAAFKQMVRHRLYADVARLMAAVRWSAARRQGQAGAPQMEAEIPRAFINLMLRDLAREPGAVRRGNATSTGYAEGRATAADRPAASAAHD